MDFWGSSADVGPSPGYGVLQAQESSPYTFEIPYVNQPVSPYRSDLPSIFPLPSTDTDGLQFINNRANASDWSWGIDQSTIKASLNNVIGSVVQAGVKTGVQVASSSINKGTQQPGNIGAFFNNFRSTQTGAQLTAGSLATQMQNFLYNPIVWFGAVALVVLVFLMRK